MDREKRSCLCTLWLIIAINGPFIIPQIIGGNWGLLLFLILVIIGAVALTIHYSRFSLQDWVSCTLKSKESGEAQLTEIEETFLNYLNENKGSAFSPRALIKRAIGENYTEEYAEKISNLLGLMTQKGIINSKFYDGKFHYFSS